MAYSQIATPNNLLIMVRYDNMTLGEPYDDGFEPKLTSILYQTDADVKPVYGIGSPYAQLFSFGGFTVTGEIQTLESSDHRSSFTDFLVTAMRQENAINFSEIPLFDIMIISRPEIIRLNSSEGSNEVSYNYIRSIKIFNQTQNMQAEQDVVITKYSMVARGIEHLTDENIGNLGYSARKNTGLLNYNRMSDLIKGI